MKISSSDSYPLFLASLSENNGYISAKKAVALGISHKTFYNYAKLAGLEKAAPGLFINPENLKDRLFVFSFRHPSLVYSHATALFLLGRSEREPLIKEFTVIRGNNPNTYADTERPAIHFVESDLLFLGRTVIRTSFGNSVPCYNLERTIVDLIRSRNKIDKDTVFKALREYAKSPEKNLPLLFNYAEKFKVAGYTKEIFEILLWK